MEYFYIWLVFTVVLFALNIAGTVFFNKRITVLDLMLAFFGSLLGPAGFIVSFFFLVDAIECRYGSVAIWPREK